MERYEILDNWLLNDHKYLLASSLMQINLSKRLWIEAETFANYFSEIFKKQFNKLVPEEKLEKVNLEEVENIIYEFILRRFFSWKIDRVLGKNPIYN